MLDVRDIHAGYQRGLDILAGVSLTARAGAITAVLGANGVGKSTLLKVIAGFVQPRSGRVQLDGQDILGTPPHRMIDVGLSYMTQNPGIFDQMTVEENLLLGGWHFRRDRKRLQVALEENYARFPVLRERRHSRVAELSGGQQRMVEISRTLMSSPRVILVDEPTAGLAKLVWRDVYGILAHLRDEGRTIVLVDQAIREALKIADYVYVLDLGRNRYDGPASQFTEIEKSFWV